MLTESALIARLWVTIRGGKSQIPWGHRLMTLLVRTRNKNDWGGSGPRLDRLQGQSNSEHSGSILLSGAEAFCLFLPTSLFQHLTRLWVGRIVYERHWNALLDGRRTEWQRVAAAVRSYLGFSSSRLLLTVILFRQGISVWMCVGDGTPTLS